MLQRFPTAMEMFRTRCCVKSLSINDFVTHEYSDVCSVVQHLESRHEIYGIALPIPPFIEDAAKVSISYGNLCGQGAVSSPSNLSMVLSLNIQKFNEWFNILRKDMKSKCVNSTSRSSIHQDAANRSISYGNLSAQGALSSST